MASVGTYTQVVRICSYIDTEIVNLLKCITWVGLAVLGGPAPKDTSPAQVALQSMAQWPKKVF